MPCRTMRPRALTVRLPCWTSRPETSRNVHTGFRSGRGKAMRRHRDGNRQDGRRRRDKGDPGRENAERHPMPAGMSANRRMQARHRSPERPRSRQRSCSGTASFRNRLSVSSRETLQASGLRPNRDASWMQMSAGLPNRGTGPIRRTRIPISVNWRTSDVIAFLSGNVPGKKADVITTERGRFAPLINSSRAATRFKQRWSSFFRRASGVNHSSRHPPRASETVFRACSPASFASAG